MTQAYYGAERDGFRTEQTGKATFKLKMEGKRRPNILSSKEAHNKSKD